MSVVLRISNYDLFQALLEPGVPNIGDLRAVTLDFSESLLRYLITKTLNVKHFDISKTDIDTFRVKLRRIYLAVKAKRSKKSINKLLSKWKTENSMYYHKLNIDVRRSKTYRALVSRIKKKNVESKKYIAKYEQLKVKYLNLTHKSQAIPRKWKVYNSLSKAQMYKKMKERNKACKVNLSFLSEFNSVPISVTIGNKSTKKVETIELNKFECSDHEKQPDISILDSWLFIKDAFFISHEAYTAITQLSNDSDMPSISRIRNRIKEIDSTMEIYDTPDGDGIQSGVPEWGVQPVH